MIENFLLVLGLWKGWVVNRRLRLLDTLLSEWGRKKKFFYPRISLDDQDINLMILID